MITFPPEEGKIIIEVADIFSFPEVIQGELKWNTMKLDNDK